MWKIAIRIPKGQRLRRLGFGFLAVLIASAIIISLLPPGKSRAAALAVDSSTPAFKTAGVSSNTIVSNTFSPPAGSLIAITAGFAGASATANTITDSLGTHLTYTKQAEQLNAGGTNYGDETIWTAPCPSAQTNMTISATYPAGVSTATDGSIAVIVFTGAAMIQNGGKNTGFSGGAVPSITVNATAAGSMVIGSFWNYTNNTAPTVPGGQTTTFNGNSFLYSDSTGSYSWVQAQSALTSGAGNITINDTAPSVIWFGAAVEILAASPANAYQNAVIDDSATYYWRLNEPSGTNAADSADSDAGTYQANATLNQPGLVGTGDASVLCAVSATGGIYAGSEAFQADPLTIEVWFKISTTTGGLLVGLDNAQTGFAAGSYTSNLYVDSAQKLRWGIYTGSNVYLVSTATVNDGNWHHAVAVEAANHNMNLYLDGTSVASNSNAGVNSSFSPSYWRLGGGNLTGWTAAPSQFAYSGNLSEAAIYNGVALNSTQVTNHYHLGNPPVAPTLSSPANSSIVTSTTPSFAMSTTDPIGANVKYDLLIYNTSSNNGTNCTGSLNQENDQSSSGTGWDNGTTAYSSGATATYTVQGGSALATSNTYCWQAKAKVPTYNFGALSTPWTFTVNNSPAAPTLSAPASGATSVAITPVFTMKTTDADSDYLRYRVYLYQSDCSTAVGASPFTEPSGSPQTGWTGQDQQTSTAYTGSTSLGSSTLATYTYQGTLTGGTTYCWKADAIDPGGSNTYGSASATQLFTTNQTPAAPTLVYPGSSATGISVLPIFYLRTTDPESDYLKYYIQLYDATACGGSLVGTFDQTSSQTGWQGQNASSGTAYIGSSSIGGSTIARYQYGGTALTSNHLYSWRAKAIDPGGGNTFGSLSGCLDFTTGASEVQIKGGIIINGGTTIQ